MRILFEYSVIPFGALVCWMFKGIKGTFDDQYTDKNYHINSAIGMVAVLVLACIIAITVTFS